MLIKVFPSVVVPATAITAGNMLADLTTANAFVAPVGVNFADYRDGRCMIEVINTATGYKAVGFISATAPSPVGDGLDSELVTNGDFSSATGWVQQSGWTIGSNIATSVVSDNLYRADISLATGCLYKGSLSVLTVTANSVDLTFYDGTFRVLFSNAVSNSYGYQTSNYTRTDGQIYIQGKGLFSGTVDDCSLKRVLSPASTGALLLATQNGARGWAYKNANFDGNALSSYKIIQYKRIR